MIIYNYRNIEILIIYYNDRSLLFWSRVDAADSQKWKAWSWIWVNFKPGGFIDYLSKLYNNDLNFMYHFWNRLTPNQNFSN